MLQGLCHACDYGMVDSFLKSFMMRWLILLVSAILSSSFGGYGAVGKNTLSLGTRGDNLGGDGVSCSSTLGAAGVVPPVGESCCSSSLGAACSVGAGGIGCSDGAALGVSVH